MEGSVLPGEGQSAPGWKCGDCTFGMTVHWADVELQLNPPHPKLSLVLRALSELLFKLQHKADIYSALFQDCNLTSLVCLS